ncbi:PAS domain-containing protein [Roseisolibacter sp. H3M3-2]|uniref:PAS domain-containing protein n=1 Tax=Roseisolibacter sp. H3M3-2 TaxID=3031323 RepID=UPI0023DC6837|nr:PAS domain-containing protein [Roseisolibacter sp. H3M3-2]MDF1501385.1 PAS domain-containing protein [Roseisolibacter sp. H3M3-2]
MSSPRARRLRPSLDASRAPRPADRAADAAPTFGGAAAALRLTPGVLDQVLERALVGLLVADGGGRVLYANRAARELGVADGAALGATIAGALRGDVPRSEAVTHAVPGSTPRTLHVDVVPARSADGGLAAVCAVADVTERTQAAAWRPLIGALMDL